MRDKREFLLICNQSNAMMNNIIFKLRYYRTVNSLGVHAGRVRWNKSEEKSKRIFGAQGKRKEKRGSANNEREIERNREKEREVEGGGSPTSEKKRHREED